MLRSAQTTVCRIWHKRTYTTNNQSVSADLHPTAAPISFSAQRGRSERGRSKVEALRSLFFCWAKERCSKSYMPCFWGVAVLFFISDRSARLLRFGNFDRESRDGLVDVVQLFSDVLREVVHSLGILFVVALQQGQLRPDFRQLG